VIGFTDMDLSPASSNEHVDKPQLPVVALRGFLIGENTFERESDRL
jgi:hypothetical protein